MKKAILSTILLLGSTSLLADTTMCFRENHQSMSTIENTPLNGGACLGKYTINDMKAKGWNVDDIKISQTATGMNFIYVLKTATVASDTSSSNFTGNQAQMEANIIAKIEKKKEAEEKAKIEQELKEVKIDAQNIYINKCQNCHGTNGEITKNNLRALRNLSVEDMEESLKDYKLGRNDKINLINAPMHTNNLDSKTIKGIYSYLKELNTK